LKNGGTYLPVRNAFNLVERNGSRIDSNVGLIIIEL
jgi:hypothetical protein